MTAQIIKKKVEEYFNLNDISDKNRNSDYNLARLFYFKACFKKLYPKHSLTLLSEEIKRTHATALHYKNKRFTTKERVLYNDFEKTQLGTVDQIEEQIKSKKAISATNAFHLVHNYKKLQSEIKALEQRKSILSVIPLKLTETLLNLEKSALNNVLDRFQVIAEMESKKMYSYSEKRRNEVKTS